MKADGSGIGRRLGERLLSELEEMGATFVTGYIVADCEEPFYEALGFRQNTGHQIYHIDAYSYVPC